MARMLGRARSDRQEGIDGGWAAYSQKPLAATNALCLRELVSRAGPLASRQAVGPRGERKKKNVSESDCRH